MRTVFLFPLLLLVSACGVHINKEGSVALIGQHPPHDQLDNLVTPPPPSVTPPMLDIPKDASGNPVSGSNIYRGYDYDNFTKKQANDFSIREYIRSLLGIISTENARRETNRQDNAKWQAQTDAAKAASK